MSIADIFVCRYFDNKHTVLIRKIMKKILPFYKAVLQGKK
jgi:hypothetical protein